MENLIYCAIDFQEFYILLYKYSLDQAKNVLPVTKWRHQVQLDFWYPLSTLKFGIEVGGSARKDKGSLKNIKLKSGVHNKLEDKKYLLGNVHSFQKSAKYQIISMQAIAYIIFVQQQVRIRPSQDSPLSIQMKFSEILFLLLMVNMVLEEWNIQN